MWEMMNFSRLKFIQLFGCFGLASCTTVKKDVNQTYNDMYYLTEEERAGHEKMAIAGSGESAFQLGEHELFWGDGKKAIYWYKRAYDLGYEREQTKVIMESSAKCLPELEEYLRSLMEKD